MIFTPLWFIWPHEWVHEWGVVNELYCEGRMAVLLNEVSDVGAH